MLLSSISKRGINTGRLVFKSSIKTRSFSFSSSSWTNNSSKSKSSTSSISYNFDSMMNDLINYKIAIAYQPKDREESSVFNSKRKKRNSNNSNEISPAILSPTGEDNLFVSKQSNDGYVAVGVADGVGGWSEHGYDSSAISKELCALTKIKFETSDLYENLLPKSLLISAYQDILKSSKVEIGGTTACIGILTPNKKLKVANLGDSWCGLFRNYKLINETKFQTHKFNTPFQLAKIPEEFINKAKLEGRKFIMDSPEMADEYIWDLEKDDIIIFATDGVTDNIIPKDIEIFLKDALENDKNAKLNDVAAKLVKEVCKLSKDPKYPSFFAQELSKKTGQQYLGGKQDDVTIVLIQVRE